MAGARCPMSFTSVFERDAHGRLFIVLEIRTNITRRGAEEKKNSLAEERRRRDRRWRDWRVTRVRLPLNLGGE